MIESSFTHKGVKRNNSFFRELILNIKSKALKPLLWERLKWSERFSFVDKTKVIHIVGDDKSRRAWETEQW